MLIDPVEQSLSFFLLFKAITLVTKAHVAVVGHQLPERPGLKRPNLVIAPYDHGQYGSLNAPDSRECLRPIAQRIVSSSVQPDDPNRLRFDIWRRHTDCHSRPVVEASETQLQWPGGEPEVSQSRWVGLRVQTVSNWM